jgi:eukaryotic-like serine/threonine-protein kinase
MRLWNDYEGLTVEGTFPVDKLLRPEGRSAFFTTRNGSGSPAVLRLIESIHDDAEILERWQAVSALNQPNIVAFKQFGQTVLHDEPLLYAVFEPTDISLEEILRERPLTTDETRDLATSLVKALQALHTAGLVHEHIDPANILATADTIKLRGDCIRPIPEHLPPTEAHAPVARDIHDLAVVLLRALTQHRSLDELDRSHRLPAPFDQIIPHGVSGAWSLEQIATSLVPAPTPVVTPAKEPVPVAVPVAAAGPVLVAQATPAAAIQPPVAAGTPSKPTPYQATPSPSKHRPATMPTPAADYSPTAVAAAIPHEPEPLVEDSSNDVSPVGDMVKSKPFWLATAAAVVILLSVLWHGHPTSGSTGGNTTPGVIAANPAANKPSAAITQSRIPVKPSALASSTPDRTPATHSASVSSTASGSNALQWRVVAFTYNRQDQAQHKADTIAQDHRDLRPEVFTPTGRAPFLVTLGGPMTRDKAMALRDKARNDGLPRDVYAQNYTH